MLHVDELRSFYTSYARGNEVAQTLFLGSFSPLLCHLVVSGQVIPGTDGTGHDQSEAEKESKEALADAPLRLCEQLPEEMWTKLPLMGLRPSTTTAQLQAAMIESTGLMRQFWPKRERYVKDWISHVQWVEVDPSAPGPLLTSSTFPQLPHCAFLSAKALQHIPPNIVVDRPNAYALLENLFHEALHQQLSSSLLFLDSVRADYNAKDCSRIPVPWRNGSWEPDRVLHATFVYSELLRLRLDAADAGFSLCAQHSIWAAAEQALLALEYLHAQRASIRAIFTQAGLELLDEVDGKAKSAIELGRSRLSPISNRAG